METKQPLLSICIPTYNRAHVLKDCLKSLVQADSFSDEVEIIISDNCSTDETQQVVDFFAKDYPNIKYFKNDTNIGLSRNLLCVLERGTGIYLKLSNDYNLFRKKSLTFLLETIKHHLQDKPVLYFGNRTISKHSYSTDSFDEFLFIEKTGIAWISTHGYWKDDFDKLKNKDAYIDTMFPQVDWLIRSYFEKKMIFNYNEVLFTINKVRVNTGSFNCIDVSAVNFFIPLNSLQEVSPISYEETKKYCMYQCIWMMTRSIFFGKICFRHDTHNGWKILKEQFGHYTWYKKILLKGLLFSFIAMPYEMISTAIKRSSFFHH